MLQDPVIVPETIWQSECESFSLRFELELTPRTINIMSAALLNCNVFVPNNVIRLEWHSESTISNGEFQLSAGSYMPVLMVKLITEDGKPCPIITMQSFEIKMFDITKDKWRSMNFNDFYSDQLVTGEHGDISFQPIPQPRNTAPAAYKIEITYIELRSGMDKFRPSTSATVNISPAEPKTLLMTEQVKKRLRAFVGAASEIGRDIRLEVKDKHKNDIVLTNKYNLTCRVAKNDDSQGVLPRAEFTKAERPSDQKFSKIMLAETNTAVQDGIYRLVFELEDRHGNVIVKNDEFSFQYTSNETFNRDMAELQRQQAPFQEEIQSYYTWNNALKELQIKVYNACNLNRSLPLPELHAIERRREDVQNRISSIQGKRLSAQVARKPTKTQLDIHLQGKIDNMNVFGKVIDLALVKGSKYIHVLSLACRSSIDAVVCKDKIQAEELMQIGFERCYPLSMIVPFQPSRQQFSVQSPVGELPLEKIEMKIPGSNQSIEPPGNPKYLVRMY
jgi:hypothetical protein